MAKEYRIELKVDTTSSDAALGRQSQKLGQVEQQVKQVGDTQEKAAKRGADAGFVSFLKLDAQAQKLSTRIADQADKTANAQVRAAQKAAQAQTKEADRAFKASFVSSLKLESQAEKLSIKITDLAAKQAQAQTKEAEKTQARLTSMAGRALTDEEVRARAQGAINQRLNDKRVGFATRAMDAERKVLIGNINIGEKMNDVLASAAAGINPLALATAGLIPLISGQVQYWADVTAEINASAKAAVAYQEKMRGNAAVGGHLGDTTREARESLGLRTKTLQSLDESRGFTSGLLNMGAASVGSQISKADFELLKQKGGAFQASEGGDAQTHGELAGRMPALMKLQKDRAGKDVPATADEVMAQESKVFDILQFGGSEFTPGVKQLLKNSSLTQTGMFHDIHEQAGLQSFFSKSRPLEAGEMVDWATRATVGNLGRMKGVQGNEAVGQYLGGLGAKVGQTPPEMLKLISGDLARKEAQAKIARKEFSSYDFLQKHGFTREEDIKAILPFHAGMMSGEYAEFEKRAAAPASTKSIDEGIAHFKTTAAGQTRMADVGQESAQMIIGPMAAKDSALYKSAHSRLVAEKKLGGSFDADWSNTFSQAPAMIASMGRKILEESAQRNGATIGGNDPLTLFRSDVGRITRNNQDLNSIGGQGGDPVGETMQYVDLLKDGAMSSEEAKEQVNRDAALKRRQRQGLGGPALLKGRIPDLLAMPAQGNPMDRGAAGGSSPFGQDFMTRFSQVSPVGGSQEEAIGRLIGLTELLVKSQQETERLTREAEDRKKARDAGNAAGKNQPATPALPVIGPGRIPTR